MRPQKRRTERRGFTLVEILVVVVILGIAGAIIVPQITGREDLRARSAARLIMADLIYAQNRAITYQQPCWVIFDANTQSYSLQSGTPMQVLQHPVNKVPYVMRFGSGGPMGVPSTALASSVFAAGTVSTGAVIGFDELGTPIVPDPDGGPHLTMTSGTIAIQSGTFVREIVIEPFTGQIRIPN